MWVVCAVLSVCLSACGGKDEAPKNPEVQKPVADQNASQQDSTTAGGNVAFVHTLACAQIADPNAIAVSHTGYQLAFSPSTMCPIYVAWTLSSYRLGDAKRYTGSFRIDTQLPKSCQIKHEDYTNSGYDRGHMCPAADNSFSDELMKESFYMSNICPQNRSLNAGDWSELEDQCRQWAQDYPYPLHIVAGPIFDTPNYTTIGQAGRPQIAVPDRFYKVLLTVTPTGARTLGFIYPNEACNQDIRSYCVSVDEVERITGIDFFYTLEDDVENVVERECNPGRWGI